MAMILGITGTIRSGKDTAANYLVSKGFTHYSLSDYIRKVVREQGLDQTDRTILQKAKQMNYALLITFWTSG